MKPAPLFCTVALAFWFTATARGQGTEIHDAAKRHFSAPETTLAAEFCNPTCPNGQRCGIHNQCVQAASHSDAASVSPPTTVPALPHLDTPNATPNYDDQRLKLDEPGSSVERSSKPTGRRWYGWQIIIPDAAVLASPMVFTAAQSDGASERTVKNYLYFVGGLYLLGGPTVHLAHGNWGRAGASLALRAGLPATVAGLSYAAAHSYCDTYGKGDEGQVGCIGALILVGLVGVGSMLTASGADVALLAHKTDETKTKVAPTFAVDKHGGSIGVMGRF